MLTGQRLTVARLDLQKRCQTNQTQIIILQLLMAIFYLNK